VGLKKFVLPSPLWGFDSKNELDLGNHSEWIRVERDPALCELHNRDVGILCGWPNFRKKFCVFVSLISIYFMFLFKFILA
jgi:hypothetical protein